MECALYTDYKTNPEPVVVRSRSILYKLLQRKTCDALTPVHIVVNHCCKEHCVINNDVNLKFCRDNRVCGSCTLWGVMYSWSHSGGLSKGTTCRRAAVRALVHDGSIFRKAILSAFLLLCSHGRKNDTAMLRKFLRKVLGTSLRLRKFLRKVLGIRSTNGW